MPNDHDAYKPAEIAALIEQVGVAKARLPLGQMLTLAVLAGAFISFGAAGYLMVMTGADAGFGPQRLLGGVVFSLGLILVIVGGAELFTGNALMVMAAVDGKIGLGALLRNWGVVYVGNLLGALGVAAAFWLGGLADGPLGQTAATVATAKAAGSAVPWLVKGALCNTLVCLAVWLPLPFELVHLFEQPVSVLQAFSFLALFFFLKSWKAGRVRHSSALSLVYQTRLPRPRLA